MKVKKCPRCEKESNVNLEQETQIIAVFPGEEEGVERWFTCTKCLNKFREPSPKCPKCGKDERVEYKVMHQLGRTAPNVVNVWYCNGCQQEFSKKECPDAEI